MSNDAGYAFAAAHRSEDERPSRTYTAYQAFGVLKALGYNAGQADLAMCRAMSHGSWPLSRHVVNYDTEAGTYTIIPGRTS